MEMQYLEMITGSAMGQMVISGVIGIVVFFIGFFIMNTFLRGIWAFVFSAILSLLIGFSITFFMSGGLGSLSKLTSSVPSVVSGKSECQREMDRFSDEIRTAQDRQRAKEWLSNCEAQTKDKNSDFNKAKLKQKYNSPLFD